MKINRDARLNARQIFRACVTEGQLSETKLRDVVNEIADKKPRNYLPILSQIRRLLDQWTSEHTHVVESAVELPDKGAAIFGDLQKKFGHPLVARYELKPSLIGGLRIRVGSDVWDGTVLGRLNNLKQALN